jgi:HK97 gp10 family phage protein
VHGGAAVSEEIRVEGLQELRDLLLRKLPEHIQTRALQASLAKAVQPIVREAKARIPVKTGLAKRAIYSYRSRASTKQKAVRHISVRSGRRFGAKDAFYWRWIEFGRGVSVVGKKRGAPRGGERARSLGTPSVGWFGKEVKAVPARPFMRPAFEAKKYAAIEAFTRHMLPEIEKAANRFTNTLNSRLRRKAFGI